MTANDCPLAVVGVFHVPSARTLAQQRTDAKSNKQKPNKKLQARTEAQ